MDDRERRRQLRGAVARGDGVELLTLLQPLPDDVLQLAGDGLVEALLACVDGAPDAARRCAQALRERDWEGDEDLADALDAALGTAPTPLLRPLPVDLDELSSLLEADAVHGGGRIDLVSGEVWPRGAREYAVEAGELDEDDDEERWLWVEPEGSRAGYRDMELFVAGLTDAAAATALSRALVGRGAFRRFKDVLARWPQLEDRWYAFSDERRRGRARAWLVVEGYAARLRPLGR